VTTSSDLVPPSSSAPAPVDEAIDSPVARPLPSLKPALVVIACVAVVSFGGFALALFGSSPSSNPPIVGLGKKVPGVSLTALPASRVLDRVSSAGEPPSNIVKSLAVPNGVTVTGVRGNDAGVAQFDRSVLMSSDASVKAVTRFYSVELPRANWSLIGVYRRPHGTELLAQRAGNDGYEWEVGVDVTSVNPRISPSLAGSDQSAPSTVLRLRLFQIPDGS
jgi:hypothetical protein